MTRHEIREEVFKIIFGIDFQKEEDLETLIRQYIDASCEFELTDEEKMILIRKAMAVGSILPELDNEINEVAEGWKTNRMGKAELNILRLAVYEIRHDDTVPVKVAVNEAVELSKEYCNDDTPAFINGLLAHFCKEQA